jgi:hypothetical protein
MNGAVTHANDGTGALPDQAKIAGPRRGATGCFEVNWDADVKRCRWGSAMFFACCRKTEGLLDRFAAPRHWSTRATTPPKLREIWREGVSKGREHGLTAVGRGIEGCRLSVDALLVPFPGVSSLGEGVGRPSRRNPGRLRRGRAVARPSGAVRFRLLPRATSIRWAAPGRGTPRAAPGRASPTPSGRRSAGRSCG